MQLKLSTCGALVGGSLLSMGATQVAIAEEFLSVDAAIRGAFVDADRSEAVPLGLSTEQQQQLLLRAGPQPQRGKLQVFRVWHQKEFRGYYFVDEVIGRQNLITYGVGISPTGVLSAVDILSYRESHGGEVRNSRWRAQFAGRSDLKDLRFISDIKNIAGATLSCEHVTQGVRWVHALWQLTLQPSVHKE